MTVTGARLGEMLPDGDAWIDDNVIRRPAEPIRPVGGLVALFGSLAPKGAIFKRAAADGRLFETTGRAVVFNGLQDLSDRIDSPDLDVTPDDILVLKNAGPKAAGMPESGYLPIPAKLARRGVKDMLRISDARMSGTAYGTIVLHVSPESAAGGPLARVCDGDLIHMSVAQRRLDLLVDDDELARRVPTPAPQAETRGWLGLYNRHVLQVENGCDLDFLVEADRPTMPACRPDG
jgi:dihydroxy-acid dehydratase